MDSEAFIHQDEKTLNTQLDTDVTHRVRSIHRETGYTTGMRGGRTKWNFGRRTRLRGCVNEFHDSNMFFSLVFKPFVYDKSLASTR